MAASGEPSDRLQSSPRENPGSSGLNSFKNDGSFLAMFQKKMEEQKKQKEEAERRQDGTEEDRNSAATNPTCMTASGTTPSPAQHENKLPATKKGFLLVGKRKGPILKTGVVKKKKPSGDKEDPKKKDPWEQYMAEVQKYKAHQCCDDDKTRPLVK